MIHRITNQLKANSPVLLSQLTDIPETLQTWKKDDHTWCLLEIICHLYDEERNDFRYRIQHIMQTPEVPLPKFNPLNWVVDHRYMDQSFLDKLEEFRKERNQSIQWLQDNINAPWDSIYQHATMGDLTPSFFLLNWLAHDFIHIRQINRTIYQYYESLSEHNLEYAGNW